jgi:hypothetical protein
MSIVSISPTFAFFSKRVHRITSGRTTVELKSCDCETVVKANWIGPAVSGFPGIVRGSTIVRPPNHESYVRVGEVGPGKLQIVKRRRPVLRFSTEDPSPR